MSNELIKLLGAQLETKDGLQSTESLLNGKIVALYFSAHWCPPCRKFTPLFADVYSNLVKDGKDVAVVFVSSDQDEEAFNEYFGTHPWHAIPFSDEERRGQVAEHFGIQGIPAVLVFNADGKLISKDGRGQVSTHKEAVYETWSKASPVA
jgi:nucleoredoxin